ncbi:hypothetical protein OIU77_016393 [Salix suchowensis]|uniref:Acyltransferase n=1 Tax=Salix suchowensis TaxID=1278906 RepID=A0ABQ8ZK73_9ROSI|nr:hypothetical protein OIU77_016393 [Salix suchowensis]
MSTVTAGGSFLSSVRCCAPPSTSPLPNGRLKLNPVSNTARRLAFSTEQAISDETTTERNETTMRKHVGNGRLKKETEEGEGMKDKQKNPYALELEKNELDLRSSRKSLEGYFEESKNFMAKSSGDGPPRWFSPLECGSRLDNSPLLLFLPGIDGIGLGLSKQHNTLGKIFDIWCLHIPVKDRTSFLGLVKLIERTHQLTIPYMLSLMTGDSLRMAMDNAMKGFALQQTIGGLSQDLVAMSSYLNALAAILPRETLLWKLQMLKTASAYANSRLHAVKSQTLVLSSGRDQLLPSEEEGQRLYVALPKCEIRKFNDSGHFLFLEHDVDLATIIKGASYYRRGNYLDYNRETLSLALSVYCWHNISGLFVLATSPVMLSSFQDGKIVRGLAGVPSEGPVLFVGYHMLMGFEVVPLISNFLLERNILIRGIAHPLLYVKLKKEGMMPPLQQFDAVRTMGAVPVSGSNFYKLMSSKAHALLYPGGMREASHRKGEEYKLFWPEKSEFVRMASRFGAKIVPFGVVGEDDFGEVVFDYDDQMKIPFLRDYIKGLSEEIVSLRTEADGSITILGKPIETEASLITHAPCQYHV